MTLETFNNKLVLSTNYEKKFHSQNELAYWYLEKTVVTPGVELGGLLNVIVEGPEVLDCAEGDDGSLVLLPASVPVVFEEPQGPFVLKKSKS